MDYLVKEKPSAVSASGKAHVNGREDTAYVTVYFTNNMIAHFNVNWLSPVKLRTVLIGGEKRMLVWNDLAADEKIKIYDKGVEVETKEGIYERLVSYRSGDISVPRINQVRGAQGGDGIFYRMHQLRQNPHKRRTFRPQSREATGGVRSILEKQRGHGEYMKYLSIEKDVQIGENVKLAEFINLYGCFIGDNTRIGAFVEIPEKREGREKLQDFKPYIHL